MQVAFFVLEIKTMKDLVLNQVTMTSREIAELTGKRQTNKITYVLKKKGTNLVKIGRTKNLARRLRTLRTMSGCDLEIIFTYAGDIELFLHTKFAPLRRIGEWFEDTDKDIEGFLSKDVNKLTFLNAENSIQDVKLDMEKIMVALNNKFFKLEDEVKSALVRGEVGGEIALELYSKLPSPLYYEESVASFLGCPTVAFVFEDAVYYVGPTFGVKFNTLEEYIKYYQDSQRIFAVENNINIEELPSWNDFAIFMRKYNQDLVNEVLKIHA